MITKSREWSRLRSLSRRLPQGRRRWPRRACTLFLEPLEHRTLPASLSGSVWNDLVADGVRAAGEPALAGMTVFLEQAGARSTTTTNGSGAFSFSGLSPGTYKAGIVLPPGASATSPAGGSQTVQLGAGQDLQVNFGVQVAPVVPTNLEVTTDPAVQQAPSIAVNPHDATHLVMAYMDYSLLSTGYAGIAVAVSHDGGTTWQQQPLSLPANFDGAANMPVVRFDDAGRVFVSFMAGKFLGVDSNGAALKPGVMDDSSTQTVSYLGKTVSRRSFGMQGNNGIFVARSDDGGLTFSPAVAVSSQRYDLTATTSQTAVTAPGSVAITPALMPSGMYVGKALIIDEGQSSMERVTVTAFTSTTFTATFARTHAVGFSLSVPVVFDTLPDLAIDTFASLPGGSANPNYGKLYATWSRFYPASQFPGRPTMVGGSQVMFAVSQDGGQTWTTQLQTGGFSTIKDPLTGATGGSSATAVEGTGTNAFSRVSVGPEGGVYVSQYAGGRFPVFYSANAGATFRNPVPGTGSVTMAPGYPFGLDSNDYTSIYPSGASVSSFNPSATLSTPVFVSNDSFRTFAVRALAADPARPGYVYAVEAVQIITTNGTVIDPGEITFSRSTDFGVTWQNQLGVTGHPLSYKLRSHSETWLVDHQFVIRIQPLNLLLDPIGLVWSPRPVHPYTSNLQHRLRSL